MKNGLIVYNRVKDWFIIKVFAIIVICWMVWIISYYPASMDNDVFNQLYAWLVLPNDHHPWFTTCILGICYNFGVKIGSENTGIFIYVIVRDIFLAYVFAKTVDVMRRLGIPRPIYIISAIFYAATPFFGAYAKHAFKDTLSMGLFCAFTLTMFMIIFALRNGGLSDRIVFLHGVCTLILCMSRHNCIYAVFPAELLLILYLFLRKQRNKGLLLVLFLGIFFLYQKSLGYFGIQSGSSTEALSIPLQQMARVYRDHYEELSEEDLEKVEEIFDIEGFSAYNPVISDPIKSSIKQGEDIHYNADEIISLYGKWFFKYPMTYLEAAVGQSWGYYSFTPRLPEQSGNWNSGMTIFDWCSCNGDYDEQFDFHYIKKMYGIRSVLHAWAKVWDKIPVLCLTDICAVYTWLIVIFGYYLLIKKNYPYLIPFTAFFIMISTCIASPVNDCFRYYCPVAASFPVVLCIVYVCFVENKMEDSHICRAQ